MEMQEATAPIKDIRKGNWRIDMCFEYTEEGKTILQWCQGTVLKVIKEDKYYIVIEVQWDGKFVRSIECNKNKEKLKISD